MRTLMSLVVLVALPAGALADSPSGNPGTKRTIVVTSAFKPGEAIPGEFTCDGNETSPPLAWSNVPSETQSIAVLVEDRDAPKGTFTHWLVTGIPPTTTSLPAGAALPEGATAAKNDKGYPGYAGPCPPAGRHHYIFHVYALD